MVADGQVTQEERLLQGHHRQGTSTSLRLYSRDDVHGQLSVQRKLIDRVHRGQRFSTPRTGERSVRQLNLQFKWSFFERTPQTIVGNASTSTRFQWYRTPPCRSQQGLLTAHLLNPVQGIRTPRMGLGIIWTTNRAHLRSRRQILHWIHRMSCL
jgi:hypothetical protein